MKVQRKRYLALLLAVTMMSSALPAGVLAADEEIDFEGQCVKTVGEEQTAGGEESLPLEEVVFGEDTQKNGEISIYAEDAENKQEKEEGSEDPGIPATVFPDIGENHWYYDSVRYVMNKGIMTGMGDGWFAPAGELKRAQFATILWRISGSPKAEYKAKFSDVYEGNFYTEAVMWASAEGIEVVTGYDNGKFGPADNITREQVATMLHRYAKYQGFLVEEPEDSDNGEDTQDSEDTENSGDSQNSEDTENSGDSQNSEDTENSGDSQNSEETENIETMEDLSGYEDEDKVTFFAKEAMLWAVKEGIITGDNGKLNPQGESNRAVCATMITRFIRTYLPGKLPNIEMKASCKEASAKGSTGSEGTFTATVTGVSASMDIKAVQVSAGINANNTYFYTAEKQEDGSYKVSGNVANHGNYFGTYQMQAYVLLSNGVRLPVGSPFTAVVEGSEAQRRIRNWTTQIYNQVGRDLLSCYWWVVNNVTYQSLPIPLNPPAGYTRAENYALYAYENRKGNCYCYAAAFYFLAKGLGYHVEFVEGQVGLAAGGYGPHGWVRLYENGMTYYCDPEAQYEIGGYNFFKQPQGATVLNYLG